jgi:hypothetical protein
MQYRYFKRLSLPVQIIMACGVGTLLGLLSVLLPPYLLIVGLGALIYIAIVWIWPEFALLGIVLLLSTAIDENGLPSIPIGVGHIIVSDIILFSALAIILLRGWVEPGFGFRQTPLDVPLLAFYGVAILSTVLAIAKSTVTINASLGEIRTVNLYLTFFIVTNLIRNEKHLRRLLGGIFVLATLVAILMIAQYFLGDLTKILPGRVETVFTAGTSDPGVTRILPPGQSIVLVALIAIPILLIVDQAPSKFFLRFFQLAMVGIAVLLTFNRNFWVAVVLALLLIALLISIPEKIRFFNIAVWTTVFAAMVFIPLVSLIGAPAQNFIDSTATRFGTLINPSTLNEGSLQDRYVENQYALPQIEAHPLLGLGLGARYRPRDQRIDFGTVSTDKFAYIHDGHFWLMMKTGLIGYLLFVLTLFLFLYRSLSNWRKIRDPYLRAISLSFAITVIGLLPATIVNPIFFEAYWTPLLGIMMGTCEVILRLNLGRPLIPVLSERVN